MDDNVVQLKDLIIVLFAIINCFGYLSKPFKLEA